MRTEQARRANSIIHAVGVRVGGRRAQSSGERREAPEFGAQVLEVVVAGVEAEHFLNDVGVVGKGSDVGQRRSVEGADEPACRGENQGVLNDAQWHTTVVELAGKESIGTTDYAYRSGCGTIGCEKVANVILPLVHQGEP